MVPLDGTLRSGCGRATRAVELTLTGFKRSLGLAAADLAKVSRTGYTGRRPTGSIETATSAGQDCLRRALQMFIQSALPMETTTMTTPGQDSNAKSPPPLSNMPWPRSAAEATPVITP